jgi:hypothetical protein
MLIFNTIFEDHMTTDPHEWFSRDLGHKLNVMKGISNTDHQEIIKNHGGAQKILDLHAPITKKIEDPKLSEDEKLFHLKRAANIPEVKSVWKDIEAKSTIKESSITEGKVVEHFKKYGKKYIGAAAAVGAVGVGAKLGKDYYDLKKEQNDTDDVADGIKKQVLKITGDNENVKKVANDFKRDLGKSVTNRQADNGNWVAKIKRKLDD